MWQLIGLALFLVGLVALGLIPFLFSMLLSAIANREWGCSFFAILIGYFVSLAIGIVFLVLFVKIIWESKF